MKERKKKPHMHTVNPYLTQDKENNNFLFDTWT